LVRPVGQEEPSLRSENLRKFYEVHGMGVVNGDIAIGENFNENNNLLEGLLLV
jgi:hypothetical protein